MFKVYSRLRLLLWKIAWNILPTRSPIDLAIHQTVLETSLCPLCEAQLEMHNHLFLDCKVSRLLWREAPWPLFIDRCAAFPIVHWLYTILDPTLIGIPVDEQHHFQLML